MIHATDRNGRRVKRTIHGIERRQVLPGRTRSLCPECLAVADAILYEEDDRVLMKKYCAVHGTFTELISSDATFFRLLAERDRAITRGVERPLVDAARPCPEGCGLCANHLSGPIMVNIDLTNRCNLRCPICFANAGARGQVVELSLDQVRRLLDLAGGTQECPPLCLQYSGGEPTVHPQFLEMVKEASRRGFAQIQIATNGLKFAHDPEFAARAGQAGLNAAYLQFDGLTDAVYEQTRGRPLLDVKQAALENLYGAGIRTILVPTIIKGINDDQVGAITRFAIDYSEKISGISWQPVAFTGRLDHQQRLAQRFTVADLAREMEGQTGFVRMYRDWYPFCFVDPFARLLEAVQDQGPNVAMSCHPACGAATFLIIDSQTRRATPIPAFVDVEPLMGLMGSAAQRLYHGGLLRKLHISHELAKLRRYYHQEAAPAGWSFDSFVEFLVDFADFRRRYGSNEARVKSSLVRHRSLLMACMHFQDVYNYQLDRVRRCVIHYAAPDGYLYPFCSYNSGPCHRRRVEERFAVPEAQYEFTSRGGPTS
jgi:uncharacterized radical SAM superfamily Fe-S cluster-containing enzyme